MTDLGLFLEGAEVLLENIKIVSVLSVNIIGIGVLVVLGISAKGTKSEWRKHGVALLSTGVCLFVLVSYAIVAISRIWHSVLSNLSNGLLILSLLGVATGLFLFTKKVLVSGLSGIIIPLAITALIVLVRFAFLKQLDYPLYHDSAEHYHIVDDLQNLGKPEQSANTNKIGNLNSERYYHLGFHSAVVVLATQLRGSFNGAQLILITGHAFLIIFFLNLGILASKLFSNSYAGISTIIFAGLGWSMPAYAINWGKYPAISSLAILPLAVYWMINSYHPTHENRRGYILLFGISVLCAILLHSRSLLILGCVVTTMLTLKIIWKRLSKDGIDILFCAEIGLILLIIHFRPNLQAALLPYLKSIDLVTTLLAIAIMFFVASQNTKAVIGILTLMTYVAITSTIPTPAFLAREAGPYLLDRPFLQILLFAPLSLFVGGGFSYFMMELRSRISRPRTGRLMVSIGLISLTVLAIIIRPLSDFKPSQCCVYMRIDDIFLIGWIEENLPKSSRILISTSSDINTRSVKIATDAGVWITPLTELDTIKFDYRTDFSDPILYNTFCRENIGYIYVSAVNLSFSITRIEDNKKNYSPVIVLPDSRLYRVNCHLSLPVNRMAILHLEHLSNPMFSQQIANL